MIVIKFGGHAMGSNPEWMSEIAARWRGGTRFVIVHGGGPAIDQQLEREGVVSEFKDGYRITSPEIMRVVESVLTGSVLRQVVRNLRAVGLPAVGITGSDNGLLEVELKDGGEYGLVGSVSKVNPKLIVDLITAGYLPVIAPVANDKNWQALNINADIAAGAIAGALGAEETLFMTDVAGIYRNWPDKSSLIDSITVAQLAEIEFEAGMIPKVAATINAIQSGARSARIFDGKSLTAFQEALAGKGGTWVKS